jgi:hypothetical protein
MTLEFLNILIWRKSFRRSHSQQGSMKRQLATEDLFLGNLDFFVTLKGLCLMLEYLLLILGVDAAVLSWISKMGAYLIILGCSLCF